MNQLSKPFSCVTLAAALLATAGAINAQAPYPSKPVRIVTMLPAGGDTYIRVLGGRLAELFGQPVIIDNRPGAAGVLAVQAVTGAAPDGHTLIVHASSLLISKAMQPSLAIDPVAELAPAVRIHGGGPIGLLVSGASPANRVEDLVARLKASPGKMNYGTPGPGLIHLASELFLNATQTRAVHIPFKGSEVYTALMRGDVDFTVSPLTLVIALVKSGKMRILGTMNAARHRALPDVPLLSEVFKNDLLILEVWSGLAAPAKTPAGIVRVIHDATMKALQDPTVRDSIEVSLNIPGANESTEEFAAFVRRENDKLQQIVKLTGLKAE